MWLTLLERSRWRCATSVYLDESTRRCGAAAEQTSRAAGSDRERASEHSRETIQKSQASLASSDPLGGDQCEASVRTSRRVAVSFNKFFSAHARPVLHRSACWLCSVCASGSWTVRFLRHRLVSGVRGCSLVTLSDRFSPSPPLLCPLAPLRSDDPVLGSRHRLGAQKGLDLGAHGPSQLDGNVGAQLAVQRSRVRMAFATSSLRTPARSPAALLFWPPT